MNPPSRLLLALAAAFLIAPVAFAQEEHRHSHGDAEELGIVHFPNTCSAEVGREFTRAVALLHSFGYEEARLAFESVAEKDPSCGIAYWGIAMTYYRPIWAPPTPAELRSGEVAARKAEELGAKTDRERGYIAAIGAFYRDTEHKDHRARALAYRDAIEALSREFPDDHEARIFYALALLATAPPNDASYANQRKAAGILNALLSEEPQHPGITHYMIHAFDYPELASEALPAARAYAKIAPSSPHALHMPSHIFTRLGLWQESIASNIESAEAGRRTMAKRQPGAVAYDTLHALDYLEYAYLQIGDDDRARAVLDESAAARTFDEPGFQAGYALVAIPVRWTLERRAWKAAADLARPAVDMPWERYPYAPAITSFAQALGAARVGRLEQSRAALQELSGIQAKLASSPVPGPYDWAGQVESLRLAAAAWLSYAEGKKGDALKMATLAAQLQDTVGKHPVTPGAPLPARELLGDLLLELGRPADALEQYEASLREAPNRFNGLYGAARAAELSGQPTRARELYTQLIKQCVTTSSRPELAAARRYVGAPASGR